jgi:NAD(P)-dependent dehydrogenase (short-subunit alcohol dehydrogenase family)
VRAFAGKVRRRRGALRPGPTGSQRGQWRPSSKAPLAPPLSLTAQVLAIGRPLDLLVCNAGRFLDAPFGVTEDGFEQARARAGGLAGWGGGCRLAGACMRLLLLPSACAPGACSQARLLAACRSPLAPCRLAAARQVHAVNFWGHAYLTLLLLGRIIQAGPARIVQVVSFGEILGRVHLSDLRGAAAGTSGLSAYCNRQALGQRRGAGAACATPAATAPPAAPCSALHRSPPAPLPTRPRSPPPLPPPPSKLIAYVWLSELQARLRRAGARVDCFATQPG